MLPAGFVLDKSVLHLAKGVVAATRASDGQKVWLQRLRPFNANSDVPRSTAERGIAPEPVIVAPCVGDERLAVVSLRGSGHVAAALQRPWAVPVRVCCVLRPMWDPLPRACLTSVCALQDLFDFAIALCNCIGTLHDMRMVHLNLSPGCLLWQREVGQVLLLDVVSTAPFSFNHGVTASNVAYCAPEQVRVVWCTVCRRTCCLAFLALRFCFLEDPAPTTSSSALADPLPLPTDWPPALGYRLACRPVRDWDHPVPHGCRHPAVW